MRARPPRRPSAGRGVRSGPRPAGSQCRPRLRRHVRARRRRRSWTRGRCRRRRRGQGAAERRAAPAPRASTRTGRRRRAARRAAPRLSPSRIASSRSTTPACATARVTFGWPAAQSARCPPAEWPIGDARRADQVERRRDVVERRRPAAPAAEPAVLDIPRLPPRGGEVLAELVHQVPVVCRPARSRRGAPRLPRAARPAGAWSSTTCAGWSPYRWRARVAKRRLP